MLEGWGPRRSHRVAERQSSGSRSNFGLSPEHPAFDRRGDKERIEGRRNACAVEDPGHTVLGTRSKTMTYILLNVVVKGDRT